MAVCPRCGSEVSDASNFCTSCGQPMARTGAAPAAPAPAQASCVSCGARLDPDSRFCTGCGAAIPTTPVGAAATAQTVRREAVPATEKSSVAGSLSPAEPPADASSPATSSPSAAAVTAGPGPEPAPLPPPARPPQSEPQIYTAPSVVPPVPQPGGGRFGLVVLVLLIVIIAAGFGGWYFWGVETIVVCSPPDVRVFLDGQEVSPASYGRYVIPHLSRKTHLLRVQAQGFADTIQRLDFPLTSSREWVNIRLVPSRQLR